MSNRKGKSSRFIGCMLAVLLAVGACAPMTACNDTPSEPVQGEQGEKGEKGDPGIQGEKGDKGDTGAQGEQGIPGEKGEKGDKGDKGDPGEKGDKGDTGSGVKSVEKTGSDGLTDTYTITFEDGTTATFAVTNGKDGTDGTDGIDGEKGEKGDTGAQGEKGDTGATGAQGAQGIPGVKGDKGDTGATGAKGDRGETGNGILTVVKTGSNGLVDTYTITFTNGTKTTFTVTNGKNGTNGTNGQDGAKGDKGDKGDTGATGATGAQGVKGDKGDTGATGATGESAYEAYCRVYGYRGSEEQWLADMAAGRLTQYTVSFDLNGGTAGAGYAERVTVSAGTTLTLTIPTRTGYHFVGWFTAGGVNAGQVTNTTPIGQDMTLTAQWQIDVLTVTFLGYSGETLATRTVEYGGAAAAPSVPEVSKMNFSTWDKDFSKVTADMTVKALYVPDTYTVTYNTDGGTTLASQEYYMGDTPRQGTTPTKKGYYFVGWYKDSAHKQVYKFDKPLNANTTLYAYFSEMLPLSTAEDLLKIKDAPSAKYCLTCDIDLEGAEWKGSCAFSGLLDGQGYSISNFTMTGSGENIGFFTTNSGTIKNVTFSDLVFSVNKDSTYHAGVIAGTNTGSMENCKVSDVSLTYTLIKSAVSYTVLSYVGGLTGTNNGTIKDCTFQGSMTGKVEGYDNYDAASWNPKSLYVYTRMGGIAGQNLKNQTITGASVDATLKITCIANGYNSSAYCDSVAHIGGVVGYNYGLLSESKAKTDITMTGSGGKYRSCQVAGLCATNESTGTIKNCVSTGTISAEYSASLTDIRVGGLAYSNLGGGTISNSFSNVNISIPVSCSSYSAIGGFVGDNYSTIINCYNTGDIETACTNDIGGFCGYNNQGGSISKCFTTGNITLANDASNVGYFIGRKGDSSVINKCYYSNTATVKKGNSVYLSANTDGESKTLSELQSKAFLIDTLKWSADIWRIIPGDFPRLAWEE